MRAELYGTDENIKRRLAAVKEQGESVQGCIRTLIRVYSAAAGKISRLPDGRADRNEGKPRDCA